MQHKSHQGFWRAKRKMILLTTSSRRQQATRLKAEAEEKRHLYLPTTNKLATLSLEDSQELRPSISSTTVYGRQGAKRTSATLL